VDDRPPPKRKWVLTQESFDALLSWLDPDRERAGKRYESIRLALTRRFRQLGGTEPEDLANQTIDRVAKKLPEIIQEYVGEPEPYFFSVAYYVYKEHLKGPVLLSLTSSNWGHSSLLSEHDVFDKELLDFCLEHCMERLDQTNRDMIREYYQGERRDKIKTRNALAERLGIKLSNLRLRAQRVRTGLKKCIVDCMERKAAERELSM